MDSLRKIDERFVLLEPIGPDESTTVYAAQDLCLQRKVAVKLLGHAVGDDAERRFIKELRLLASMHHPTRMVRRLNSHSSSEIDSTVENSADLVHAR